MRSTFNTLFYIKRNEPRKDGSVVIMVRITIDGERSQFSSKLEIHPDLWNSKIGRVKGNTAKANNLNRLLDNIRASISQHYTRLMDSNGYVMPDKIKNALLGIEEKGKTIISFFEKHNEQYKLRVGTTTTWKTYTRYELTKNRLIEFLKEQYNLEDIPVKEIKTAFLLQFYFFLRKTHHSGNNHAMKYLQRLRTVLNYVRSTGLEFTDPYINFKMGYEKTDRSFLEKEEIDTIYSKKFVSDRLEKVRDIFVFSCYTGLSYCDLASLKQENIVKAFDNNLWIMSKRNKTGEKFNVRLFDIPKAILDKYTGKQKDGRLLPLISNQKMNEYLYEIAEICGINKIITCHVARHTFATLCITEGVPIESVSKMLGHTNIQTTQIYARIIDQKLSKDMGALAEKLQVKTSKQATHSEIDQQFESLYLDEKLDLLNIEYDIKHLSSKTLELEKEAMEIWHRLSGKMKQSIWNAAFNTVLRKIAN